MKNHTKVMPFWDHLEELRWRLIKIIIVICIGGVLTYRISEPLIYWLILPAKSLQTNINFQVLKVTTMFSIKMTVAFFGGLFLGFPVVMYQCWRFVSPAFEDNYGFTAFLSIIFSSIFFIIGISFAYLVIIPFSLVFFTSLTSSTLDIIYNFTLEGYLIYILWIVFSCGLLFQLPVVAIFFTKIGILTPAFLKEYRKFAIIIFLLLGAILTPPDPISQILIVIPLILLYECSIIISKLFQSKDFNEY